MRAQISHSGAIGAAIALLITSAGCGSVSQNLTSPSPQISGAVSALSSPDVPIFNVDGADTSADGHGPCIFDHANVRFGCGNLSQAGLTLTRTVTFYDASGVVQPSYDRVTTASIKTETSVTGTATRDGNSITVNRSGIMTVTGLAGAETTRTINGTEQGTLVATKTASDGTVTTISTTLNDTTTDLVVPIPAGRNLRRFPLSGTRSHATTATTTRGTDTRTDTLTRTETFDGTAIVQVVLTINGVTQNCGYNLATKRSTCHR